MLEIAYLVGLLLTFPFYIGTIANALKYHRSGVPEGIDYGMAALITLLTLWLYPVMVPGYYLIRGVKAFSPDLSVLRFVFPTAPAPLTAHERRAKNAAKEREQRELHAAQMRLERVKTLQARERINELEAEAGIPLTEWKN
jgi:hypothetical protein